MLKYNFWKPEAVCVFVCVFMYIFVFDIFSNALFAKSCGKKRRAHFFVS